MADARDCGIVQAALQGLGSWYIGEFSGYAFPIEQSDRVLGTGHGDIVHQGLGTVGYM